MPPSFLYIMTIVVHIPGNLDLWTLLSAANEADWIERRVRTISSGYVKKTEVIPAAPPHINRLNDERSAPGVGSKNYYEQLAASVCRRASTLPTFL